MTARRPLIEAALDAAGRGWPVFPLCPGRKLPRKEATGWQDHNTTTDPDVIARWWATHPIDNVGIATGPAGLVVVDLDVPKPGQAPPPEWAGARHGGDVLARLVERHGPLPVTYAVDTPSGGRHLYFWAPAGVELRNTQGVAGWKVDTRAVGGYVAAAGSRIGPRTYDLVADIEPAELPAWLAQLVAPPPAPAARRPGRPAPRARGYVAAALDGEVRRVLEAGPGRRNDALNRAAWSLGRFVADGVLPRHVVEDALNRAATAAGYRDGPRAAARVVAAALDSRTNRGHHR